jgi:AcrR family transcriptional regulator
MEEVKTVKRRYNSARRQEQARETRRQILAAARRLFLQEGYTGATVDAIAAEAGVAVETVYAAFRNKRTILARLVDVSVVGDDEQVPLLEREGPQAARQETDQRRQIALFARGIREIMGRVGALFEVMRVASASEPEIALLLEGVLAQRLEGMRFFVQALLSNGPLRAGLEEAAAVDTVWTLTSAEVYRLLTVDRGWPVDRYEAWLAGSLEVFLLP